MFINAYYFRAHMYTIVPAHVRSDMELMASAGTNALTLGVLEQDLNAAAENIDIVCNEAARVGMKVYATPSRWGGLVAGCPKVPSLFSSKNWDAVARNRDGSPTIHGFGPVASVHHPATIEFFLNTIELMLQRFPFAGIVWDEPKALSSPDYSDSARKALAGADLDDRMVHVDAQARFFDMVNEHACRIRPGLERCMFAYAHVGASVARRLAAMSNLESFGCDGRPWAQSDSGSDDSNRSKLSTKNLIDSAPLFVDIARSAGKKPLILIENHALADSDLAIMDRRLPEVLALGAQHVLYYYYPRSVSRPDEAMAIIMKHLRTLGA